MGMVVRTNIMAVNANRQLGMNNSQVGKSLEKLASGFKINRAGDDASGLAISEKMKAQIKGLETASANSQDGISLIQTAEGALTEVHDMLNRMVEIAGKAANGTMDENVDRASLQKELKSLQEEIDRISQSTNFNGKKLLNGELDGGSSVSGAAAGVPKIEGLDLTDVAAIASKVETSETTTVPGSFANGDNMSLAVNYTDANGKNQVIKLDWTVSVSGTAFSIKDADGKEVATGDNTTLTTADTEKAMTDVLKDKLGDDFKVSFNGGKLEIESKVAGATTKIDSIVGSFGFVSAGDTLSTTNIASETQAGVDAYQTSDFSQLKPGDVFEVGGQQFSFVTAGNKGTTDKNINAVEIAGANPAQAEIEDMLALIEQKTGYKASLNTDGVTVEFKTNTSTKATNGQGLRLQIGDTADDFNQVTVNIRSMDCKGLGIDSINVENQDSAAEAIEKLKNVSGDNEYGAINIVSSVRADLGALQNRLDHTINNLDVAAENLTSANSRIRDTDMAKQMMEYTKMNVLTQSAQGMLAQANQSTQGVLQLLQ